jgi:DNA-binding IclR family transcriptional regulator
MSDVTATTLRRGIQLLEHLSAADAGRDGLGASELARAVGIDRSLAFRTLQVLHELGLVERDPLTLGFRPGWRLFTLAARAAQDRLRSLAPDVLERLSSVSGESAYLSVRRGNRVLTVASALSARVVQAVNSTGQTTPLTCTSAGRALLLDHDQDELERLLGPGPYDAPTAASPGRAGELAVLLEDARRSGVVIADGEFEAGLVGLAAPVRDFRGEIVAAVNVSGPGYRVQERVGELACLLLREASGLSARLGFTAGEAPAAAGERGG